MAQTSKKEETKATAAAPKKASATASTNEVTTPVTASTTTIASPEATTTTSSSSEQEEFPAEVISNLTGMGFPEAEAKACLRAAQGNPDVAVEFLTNGIPPAVQNLQQQQQQSGSSNPQTLQGLRNHPQFNALRRLVQTNPQTLQSVLTQIGQQQPELLREINSNQAAFLEMMNEPVEDDAPAPSSTTTPSSSSSSAAPPPSAVDSNMTGTGNPAGMLSGMSNPAQMAQMLQNMSPQELQSMATMMGLTPEQLTATAQMISQMPPDQFQEYMNMVQSGGMPGMEGLGPGGGGGGGPQVIRLNEEEMAAVDRLTEMGFDHSEAAQAYLACDKNEALAANLLMDGGFGFSDDMGNDRSGNHGGNGGENDDDMYD